MLHYAEYVQRLPSPPKSDVVKRHPHALKCQLVLQHNADTSTDVDSFHPTSHPNLPTIELHGYLRSLVCLTCRTEYSRKTFQSQLSKLNPAWTAFLEEILRTGALGKQVPLQMHS